MYTLADVYKSFPSGCTEEYKILRAFEMGKQTSNKEIESLSKHILDLQKDKGNLTDRVRELEQEIEKMKFTIKFTIKFELEDIVPYTVLNNILVKLGVKEK